MGKEQEKKIILGEEKKPVLAKEKPEKAKVDVEAFIKRKLKIANKLDNELLKETIARKLYSNK